MSSVLKLIIEDDAGKQIVVPFTRDLITIGRKEGNTIRLTERNVSRNHARLSRENGHVLLEDLGSYNGIKLNGDRIEGRVAVLEGDTIQIGDYHLALHVQQPASAGGDTRDPASTPPPRSQGGQMELLAQNDQFAGDTQRWVPPRDAGDVQSLPTQEDSSTSGRVELASAPSRSSPNPSTDTEAIGDAFGAMRAGTPSPALHHAQLEPVLLQSAPPPRAPLSSAPAAASLPLMATPPYMKPATPASAAALLPRPSALPATAAAPLLDPLGPDEVTARQVLTITNAQDSAQMVGVASAPVAEMTARHGQPVTMPRAPSAGAAGNLQAPRLVVVNTVLAGSTFPLRIAEMIIGRTSENDIAIEHRSVSRNHAKVVREGGRVRILDLNSANGVLVNDEEVEAAVLRPGDVVELGKVRLRFVPIGERFEVTPDEIQRARLSDVGHDDFEVDSRTGVTNPVRRKGAEPGRAEHQDHASSAKQSNAVRIVIVLALIAAGVAGAAVLLLADGSAQKPSPTTPPVSGAASTAPSPPASTSAPGARAARGGTPPAPAPAVVDASAPRDAAGPASAGSSSPRTSVSSSPSPADIAIESAPDEASGTDRSAGSPAPRSPRPNAPRTVDKRPPETVLEAYRSEGLKAYLRADWRAAVDHFGDYRRWIKDDRVVNENHRKALEKLSK